MEEVKNSFKILTDTPAGKIPLGRPRIREENNNRIDVKEISIGGIGLIRLRIGIIGEPLSMRHCISGFHKPWS